MKLLTLNEPDKSTYLLHTEKHLLIYDYRIENGRVLYTYWTDTGNDEEHTTVDVKTWEQVGLLVNNRQIYYRGKKITSSSDRKLKPTLIDGEYILYLSDKHRGIGMYTLRKIMLADVL